MFQFNLHGSKLYVSPFRSASSGQMGRFENVVSSWTSRVIFKSQVLHIHEYVWPEKYLKTSLINTPLASHGKDQSYSLPSVRGEGSSTHMSLFVRPTYNNVSLSEHDIHVHKFHENFVLTWLKNVHTLLPNTTWPFILSKYTFWKSLGGRSNISQINVIL